MATLSGFICHDDYLAKTAKLTDEEVGRLFRALMAYHATGEEKEITGREWLAFDFIKEDIDRAEKVHEEKCRKNKEIRMNAIDNERQRSSTDDNERQRSSTYKDKDKEKDKDNDKEKDNENNNPPSGDKGKPQKRFTPPTVDEVRAYCQERKNNVDPQHFVDYYQSQRWKKSNGQPLTDWKAGVRTWEGNDYGKKSPTQSKPVNAQQYSQRDYGGKDQEVMLRFLEGAVKTG